MKRRMASPAARKAPWILFAAMCLFIYSTLQGAVSAQDREEEEAPRIPEIPQVNPQQEAQKIIQRIREGLQKIDENLLSASAKGVREQLKENARLVEELLKDSRSQSNQVISDIDELIKRIKYKRCGSGGGSQNRDDSARPQDDASRQPREEQQETGDLKKNPENAKQEGEKEPEGGRPNDRPGAQRESDRLPPSKDPEKANHPDHSGRWGVLPPKIQNDILNFNIENFPQKYRKWLEEYYRRINRSEKR